VQWVLGVGLFGVAEVGVAVFTIKTLYRSFLGVSQAGFGNTIVFVAFGAFHQIIPKEGIHERVNITTGEIMTNSGYLLTILSSLT